MVCPRGYLLFFRPGNRLIRFRPVAPGYRYHTSGELVSGGRSGYSWSSSARGSNGMDLDFGAAWLNPHGAPYRTYGFQLRCLSHPQGVLLAASA